MNDDDDENYDGYLLQVYERSPYNNKLRRPSLNKASRCGPEVRALWDNELLLIKHHSIFHTEL